MKPFDLELALSGHPVITRDGREATRIAYFKDASDEYDKVLCLIDGIIESFLENGKYYEGQDSIHDLFLKSETKKYYIGLIIDKNNLEIIPTTHAQLNKDDLINSYKHCTNFILKEIEIDLDEGK